MSGEVTVESRKRIGSAFSFTAQLEIADTVPARRARTLADARVIVLDRGTPIAWAL